jgi:tryptophan-rich sensory protein
MKIANILGLVISVAVCQMAGVIGSVFTSRTVTTWYVTLIKPSFTPPSWVFAPVWITLFLLMGVAAFLVWSKGWSDQRVKIALGLFILQLILNALWSVMFFGLKSPLAGLIDIVILWCAILLTIISFYRISTTAAALLAPYFLWVSFAGILNFSIWSLNR